MRRRLVLLALMFVVVPFSMGARSAKPMYIPGPIAVPEGSELDAVVKVVRQALAGRGWIVNETTVSEDGGSAEIETTLSVRIHLVKLKFQVDLESVRIEYVRSVEMKYKEKEGEKYIHPKYTNWVQNLELDINAGLSLLASGGS